MLPDALDARLRLEARRTGASIADVAREALERHLPEPAPSGRLGFFSVGDGGPPDVSERTEEFVGEAIRRRRRGRST